MDSISVTNFRKDLFNLLDRIVEYNEVLNITTKKGNVVVLSEEDYNNLMESLYLNSIPDMAEKIEEGLKTSLDDCLPEEEVNR